MTAAIANTTTTVTAGEGGLGPYINFGEDMAQTCENGKDITEATLADMAANKWFGEKTAHYYTAMEHLAAAKASFEEGQATLRRSLVVTEAYATEPGTGDRESVQNV